MGYGEGRRLRNKRKTEPNPLQAAGSTIVPRKDVIEDHGHGSNHGKWE